MWFLDATGLLITYQSINQSIYSKETILWGGVVDVYTMALEPHASGLSGVRGPGIDPRCWR